MTKNKRKDKNKDEKIEEENSRKVIGQTTIELGDLIFRNSLIISDAIPINENVEKEFDLPEKIGYMTIRAQAFSGDTFESDYRKIIKYHE